jgi:hypothetical protein
MTKLISTLSLGLLTFTLNGQFFLGTDMFIAANTTVTIAETDILTNQQGVLDVDGVLRIESDNISFNSNSSVTGDGEIEFRGTNTKTIDANGSTIDCLFSLYSDIELNNIASGISPSSNNDMQISKSIDFISGNIITNNNKLIYQNTASHNGYSDDSHIVGTVAKIGNTAFTFPVGDGTYVREVSITAPSNATDRFECSYIHADPSPTYPDNALDLTLDHISSCEYWMLNRTNGSSSVTVHLSWDSNTSCGVTDPNELRVAKWDGTTWLDLGNGGTSGNATTGTIETASAVTSFSPFTLASSTSANPLPITLLNFDAVYNKALRKVDLTWKTYSEINNDYFTIERTQNGEDWEFVSTIDGAGFSQGTRAYESEDIDPYSGLSYYRLKQTDFDGNFTFSAIRSVSIDDAQEHVFQVFPNPVINALNLASNEFPISSYQIINGNGQTIEKISLQEDQFQTTIDMSEFANGLYYLVVFDDNHSESFKISKIE